jgi:hypothetical protein
MRQLCLGAALLQALVRALRDTGAPLPGGASDFVPCVLPGFAMKDELEHRGTLTPSFSRSAASE